MTAAKKPFHGLLSAWRVRMPYWMAPGTWNQMPTTPREEAEFDYWANREGAQIEYAVLMTDRSLEQLVVALNGADAVIEKALAGATGIGLEQREALSAIRCAKENLQSKPGIERKASDSFKADGSVNVDAINTSSKSVDKTGVGRHEHDASNLVAVVHVKKLKFHGVHHSNHQWIDWMQPPVDGMQLYALTQSKTMGEVQ